jgi:hypothetical protein
MIMISIGSTPIGSGAAGAARVPGHENDETSGSRAEFRKAQASATRHARLEALAQHHSLHRQAGCRTSRPRPSQHRPADGGRTDGSRLRNPVPGLGTFAKSATPKTRTPRLAQALGVMTPEHYEKSGQVMGAGPLDSLPLWAVCLATIAVGFLSVEVDTGLAYGVGDVWNRKGNHRLV